MCGEMVKNTHFGVRLPVKLRKEIEDHVETSGYINSSEFARTALREKLEREKEED